MMLLSDEDLEELAMRCFVRITRIEVGVMFKKGDVFHHVAATDPKTRVLVVARFYHGPDHSRHSGALHMVGTTRWHYLFDLGQVGELVT